MALRGLFRPADPARELPGLRARLLLAPLRRTVSCQSGPLRL